MILYWQGITVLGKTELIVGVLVNPNAWALSISGINFGGGFVGASYEGI